MTNLVTTPPTLIAYAGLQKRGAYLRDKTVLIFHVQYYVLFWSPEVAINITIPAFEKRDGLSPEEVEQKAIAKRKMLGNIKFVGKFVYRVQ